jgi:D-sedoheptulose 7-phosphate isomerase
MDLGSQYIASFIEESREILSKINQEDIDKVAHAIAKVKSVGGRLFFCGSGGGAGHSSHATCDFRKLAGIESYSVTDNVSELTARINDDSWKSSYSEWLKVSRINSKDCVFVLSVGGGDRDLHISENLVAAMDLAKHVGAQVVGIAGRDGGYLAQVADACIVVPTISKANVTTQVEGFQALLWHLIVCHPVLESATPKWESVL